MSDIAPEVVSIAEACLGGLQGRSALLIGPEEQLQPYIQLLYTAGMKHIYQEETPLHIPYLIPLVHLLISKPRSAEQLTAASIAKGCDGRHTPLLVFDLAPYPSVEELAGLLPAVCLYTPDDLRRILPEVETKAS
jgi:hypothetical protein